MSIQSSRSSEKEIAPIAKTESKTKEIRQLYKTKSIMWSLLEDRPKQRLIDKNTEQRADRDDENPDSQSDKCFINDQQIIIVK